MPLERDGMFTDLSGPAFLIIDVVFVALLAFAMTYGALWWRRRRSPVVKRAEVEGVRDLYGKPPGEPTAASPEEPKRQ
jgi:hypothetical protein